MIIDHECFYSKHSRTLDKIILFDLNPRVLSWVGFELAISDSEANTLHTYPVGRVRDQVPLRVLDLGRWLHGPSVTHWTVTTWLYSLPPLAEFCTLSSFLVHRTIAFSFYFFPVDYLLFVLRWCLLGWMKWAEEKEIITELHSCNGEAAGRQWLKTW